MLWVVFIIFAILSVICLFCDATWTGLIFMALAVAIYFVIRFMLSELENQKKNDTIKHYYLYKNHCWNCNTYIDSREDIKCFVCRKYYICKNCGKCLCGAPWYKNEN